MRNDKTFPPHHNDLMGNLLTTLAIAFGAQSGKSTEHISRSDCDASCLIEISQWRMLTSSRWSNKKERYSGCLGEINHDISDARNETRTMNK